MWGEDWKVSLSEWEKHELWCGVEWRGASGVAECCPGESMVGYIKVVMDWTNGMVACGGPVLLLFSPLHP